MMRLRVEHRRCRRDLNGTNLQLSHQLLIDFSGVWLLQGLLIHSSRETLFQETRILIGRAPRLLGFCQQVFQLGYTTVQCFVAISQLCDFCILLASSLLKGSGKLFSIFTLLAHPRHLCFQLVDSGLKLLLRHRKIGDFVLNAGTNALLVVRGGSFMSMLHPKDNLPEALDRLPPARWADCLSGHAHLHGDLPCQILQHSALQLQHSIRAAHIHSGKAEASQQTSAER